MEQKPEGDLEVLIKKVGKMSERGKFIVLYGPNNLGKSLQIKMLEEDLAALKYKTIKIKYPVYNLKPTGPIINSVLREGVPMEEKKFQKVYAQNRLDFQPTLNEYLDRGLFVISEDYSGTGVAWGMSRDINVEELEKMNEGLLKEDLSLLLYGSRFREGIESTHRNENDDELWRTSMKNHLFLGEKYGWEKVLANQTPEKVHKDIMEILKNKKIIES